MVNPSFWASLLHFKPEEFDHPDEMSELLLTKLDAAREIAGIPFFITSDFREDDEGAHGRGYAVDFRLSEEPAEIRGRQRYIVVEALRAAGFRRIGLYDLHIHGDVDPELPDRVIWIGESS